MVFSPTLALEPSVPMRLQGARRIKDWAGNSAIASLIQTDTGVRRKEPQHREISAMRRLCVLNRALALLGLTPVRLRFRKKRFKKEPHPSLASAGAADRRSK